MKESRERHENCKEDTRVMPGAGANNVSSVGIGYTALQTSLRDRDKEMRFAG